MTDNAFFIKADIFIEFSFKNSFNSSRIVTEILNDMHTVLTADGLRPAPGRLPPLFSLFMSRDFLKQLDRLAGRLQRGDESV